MATALLTIAEISRTLSIPESTLRYRAKLFRDFLPTKGTGRKKRFCQECIERFSYISTQFDKGLVAEDIRRELEEQYDEEVVAEVTDAKSKPSKDLSLSKQEVSMSFEIKELIVPMMKVIENQEVIIAELRKQNQLIGQGPVKKGFLQKLFG
jgi:DNA-binding transcriptional MerR regulator